MNISQLQQHALSQLTGEEARLEIELLLAHVLGKSRTFLRTWPEHELSVTQLAQFESYLATTSTRYTLSLYFG
jgi:release factor glutamine methyltransferase